MRRRTTWTVPTVIVLVAIVAAYVLVMTRGQVIVWLLP